MFFFSLTGRVCLDVLQSAAPPAAQSRRGEARGTSLQRGERQADLGKQREEQRVAVRSSGR